MIALMGVAGGLLALLMPIMTGIIFDTIIPEASRNQMVQLAVILISVTIAQTLFQVTRGIALVRLEGRMDTRVQSAVWDRLLSLPVPFFRDYTAGDLANRSMGINAIRKMLSGVTLDAVLACIFSVFNLALLFYYDTGMALLALGLAMAMLLVTLLINFLQLRLQRPLMTLEGKNAGMLLQFITGIAKLRVSGTEDRALAEWARTITEKRKLGYKAGTLQNIQVTFSGAFPIIASMAIFAWMVFKIKSGMMSTGKFLAFNAAYASFQTALLQMSNVVTTSLAVIPLFERAKPILSTLPEIDENKSPPGNLSGDFEAKSINFRYSPDGLLILKEVSIGIRPGEFVAIVGGSGSGKSTLMRLLLGFEEPEAGSIYYDGQPLDTLDIREVRRQIGVVLQNGMLMQGSIFENIVGQSGLTIEDAWEAARMVGIEEDIKAMPMGMHTMVTAGGGTLSGGQRQRLIIARAIVKRPPILFFDEATSALDNRTQAIVSESLERLNVSRIVIAHRLSTIINADRIYVLDKGEMLQCGTYEELMAREGLFAELAKRQIA